MQQEITKSPVIGKDERINIAITRDLHYLVALEAIKRRLRVKDLVVHFLIQGLAGLGVDVSELTPEVEQGSGTEEAA